MAYTERRFEQGDAILPFGSSLKFFFAGTSDHNLSARVNFFNVHIHTQIDMPLTAITYFAEKGKNEPLFAKLAEICSRHQRLWSVEAEDLLLINQKSLVM